MKRKRKRTTTTRRRKERWRKGRTFAQSFGGSACC
jgi:hypothetical protein